MKTKEDRQNFIKIIIGYILMIGVYWLFKYKIVYLAKIPLSGSRLTLFAYVVLYGVGMPLFLFITRTIKGHTESIKNKVPEKKEIVQILILQSGLSMFALSIMNIVCKILFGLEANVNVENSFFDFLLLLVVAPIMEEIFFRKILLDKLFLFGKKSSILISSIFFAVPHVLSQGFPQFFYTFVLGYIWASVRYLYDDLKVTIGLHIFSNIWCGILPIFLLESVSGKIIYMILCLLVIPIIAIKNVIEYLGNNSLDGKNVNKT